MIRLLVLFLPLTLAASTASRLLDQVPVRFEANHGQFPSEVRFLSRSADRSVWLTSREAIVGLRDGALKIRPARSRAASRIQGRDRMSSTSNYFVGRDKSNWTAGAAHFGAVEYTGVYPGIDLVFHGAGRRVEYDFVVAPGSDPRQIRVTFDGARKLSLAPNGDLIVNAGGEEFRQPLPVAYQTGRDGGRLPVQASYRLTGRNEIGFDLGSFDPSRTLVIDPVLIATYFGGAGADIATAVATDSTGSIWVAGYTSSSALPLSGAPVRDIKSGNTDLFVAKFNPTLSGAASLQFATYIGGGGEDRLNHMVITGGFLYMTGFTASDDFPLAGGSAQSNRRGERDAFLVRMSTVQQGLDSLWYATYLGGDKQDVGLAVTATNDGVVYLAGFTAIGENFPLANAFQGVNRGGYDAFVAQIDTGLGTNALRFSTFLGGDGTDVATGIVLAGPNVVYVTGYTTSDNFPVAGTAFQTANKGRGDLFVTRLNLARPGLDAIDYSTFIGGADADIAQSALIDAAGRVYLAGYTLSQDFPTTSNAWQRQIAGQSDAFLIRLDPAAAPAQQIGYGSYIGGGLSDIGYKIALDASGQVALTGYTQSTDFPSVGGALQRNSGGAFDAFLVLVNPASAQGGLVYSSYIGGASVDVGYAVAAAPGGNFYVAGTTSSTSVAAPGSVFQPDLSGLNDALLVRFNLCENAEACAAQGLRAEASCDGGPAIRSLAGTPGCTADGNGGFVCSQACGSPVE